ncbi:hypothetical protein Tco_0184009 [Tanacetum coccineum]
MSGWVSDRREQGYGRVMGRGMGSGAVGAIEGRVISLLWWEELCDICGNVGGDGGQGEGELGGAGGVEGWVCGGAEGGEGGRGGRRRTVEERAVDGEQGEEASKAGWGRVGVRAEMCRVWDGRGGSRRLGNEELGGHGMVVGGEREALWVGDEGGCCAGWMVWGVLE